jgi:hypothetical protein
MSSFLLGSQITEPQFLSFQGPQQSPNCKRFRGPFYVVRRSGIKKIGLLYRPARIHRLAAGGIGLLKRLRINSVVELILGRGEGGSENESIPALKIYILWDMADSIPYLAPTQFQESIFPPIKIPAQVGSLSSFTLALCCNFRPIY